MAAKAPHDARPAAAESVRQSAPDVIWERLGVRLAAATPTETADLLIAAGAFAGDRRGGDLRFAPLQVDRWVFASPRSYLARRPGFWRAPQSRTG
ncbi:hypothetical protein [Alienimonas sp. DA493]|uniref:hypothetical protein n=1 Tax=Alienimonas sp. DA493 TaxID=3373605 RepID=UPI003754F002